MTTQHPEPERPVITMPLAPAWLIEARRAQHIERAYVAVTAAERDVLAATVRLTDATARLADATRAVAALLAERSTSSTGPAA